MLNSYGVGGVVVHVILVSAQVLLVLTLGLWDFELGLDNKRYETQSSLPAAFPLNGHRFITLVVTYRN